MTERARFEKPEALETIGSDLAVSVRSQFIRNCVVIHPVHLELETALQLVEPCLTRLQTRWLGDSLVNSESTLHRSKWTPTGPRRETPPHTREVVSNEDRHGEHARAILAEHRDNLRETENVYLLSRLVGGGGEI